MISLKYKDFKGYSLLTLTEISTVAFISDLFFSWFFILTELILLYILYIIFLIYILSCILYIYLKFVNQDHKIVAPDF